MIAVGRSTIETGARLSRLVRARGETTGFAAVPLARSGGPRPVLPSPPITRVGRTVATVSIQYATHAWQCCESQAATIRLMVLGAGMAWGKS